MKSALRAMRIGRVLLRYRLDDLLDGTPAERWLKLMRPFVPRASADIAAKPRGARLRLALQELGPIFVKFGQILSTRRDLVPPDIADELTHLQDRVAPFDGETARTLVEAELGRGIAEAYESFDTTPLASASIPRVPTRPAMLTSLAAAGRRRATKEPSAWSSAVVRPLVESHWAPV